MKRKLYCCIGGFVLAFPLIFFYTGENHMESGKPVSGVFREYSQEGLISYEAQKENLLLPAVSYAGSERTQILDYNMQKDGQVSIYSTDLLLNMTESTDKEGTTGNKEINTGKEGADDEGEKNGKEDAAKKEGADDEGEKDNKGDNAKKEGTKDKGEKDNKGDNAKKEDSGKNKNSDKKKKSDKKNKKKKSAKKKKVISLTKEEKQVLLRIVEAEATGEDIMGRMLVANVVLNRVKSDIFPDNVVDVVYANSGGIYQFSPIGDGRFWEVSISAKTRRAVRRVLRGEDYSEGALFFMARRSARGSSVNWFETHLTMVKQYGGHEFYK